MREQDALEAIGGLQALQHVERIFEQRLNVEGLVIWDFLNVFPTMEAGSHPMPERYLQFLCEVPATAVAIKMLLG